MGSASSVEKYRLSSVEDDDPDTQTESGDSKLLFVRKNVCASHGRSLGLSRLWSVRHKRTPATESQLMDILKEQTPSTQTTDLSDRVTKQQPASEYKCGSTKERRLTSAPARLTASPSDPGRYQSTGSADKLPSNEVVHIGRLKKKNSLAQTITTLTRKICDDDESRQQSLLSQLIDKESNSSDTDDDDENYVTFYNVFSRSPNSGTDLYQKMFPSQLMSEKAKRYVYEDDKADNDDNDNDDDDDNDDDNDDKKHLDNTG